MGTADVVLLGSVNAVVWREASAGVKTTCIKTAAAKRFSPLSLRFGSEFPQLTAINCAINLLFFRVFFVHIHVKQFLPLS